MADAFHNGLNTVSFSKMKQDYEKTKKQADKREQKQWQAAVERQRQLDMAAAYRDYDEGLQAYKRADAAVLSAKTPEEKQKAMEDKKNAQKIMSEAEKRYGEASDKNSYHNAMNASRKNAGGDKSSNASTSDTSATTTTDTSATTDKNNVTGLQPPGESNPASSDTSALHDDLSSWSSSTTTSNSHSTNGGGTESGVAGTLATALTGGKDPSGKTEHQRRQATMHDIQSGQEAQNEQSYMQEANRNARVEAGKDAASKAAGENEQKVANMGAVAAGAAALARGVQTADIQAQRNYQAQQKDKGVDAQREKWGAKQTAEEERGNADVGDWKYNQMQQHNAKVDELSKGGSTESVTETTTVTNEEDPKPVEEPKPQEPAPQPEPPQQQEEPPKLGEFNPQHVINGLLGSSKGEDLRSGSAQGGDADAFNYAIKNFGVRPITKAEHSNDANPLSYEKDFVRINGDKGAQAMKWLRTHRSGGNEANAATNYNVNNGVYTSDDKNKTNITSSVKWETGADGQARPV